MKRARSSLNSDEEGSVTLGRRVEAQEDGENDQTATADGCTTLNDTAPSSDSTDENVLGSPPPLLDVDVTLGDKEELAQLVTADGSSTAQQPSDDIVATVASPQDASPQLSSAEESMSEAPTTSFGGGSEGNDTLGKKAARSRGLSRTILTLQQSHLWMGGKAVPELDMGLVDSNTRVTRRMAAATTKQVVTTTETTAGDEENNGTAKQTDASPSTHSRASSTGGTVADGQAVPLPKKHEGTHQQKPSNSKSGKKGTKEAAPADAVKHEDGNPKVVANARASRSAAAAAASAAAAAVQPPARWKGFEAHVDHSLFESLRFVHQISRKAPVAKEEDVIASSAHCTPRPLTVFTNMMLMYAPDALLEAAGAKKKYKSHRSVS
jgi:hypothetical protein